MCTTGVTYPVFSLVSCGQVAPKTWIWLSFFYKLPKRAKSWDVAAASDGGGVHNDNDDDYLWDGAVHNDNDAGDGLCDGGVHCDLYIIGAVCHKSDYFANSPKSAYK